MAHSFGGGFQSFWLSQGWDFVPLDAGMATLVQLMALPTPHAGVLPISSMDKYLKFRKDDPHPLMAGLADRHMRASGQPAVEPAVELGPLATAVLRASDRAGTLRERLVELVMEILETDDVDTAAPVVELGLSSMHTVDLMTQLGELTGLDLSPTLVYEAVSIDGMTNIILKALEELIPAGATAAAAPDTSSATPYVQKLLVAGDPKAVLLQTLVELVSELTESDDVDTAAPVVELGLSSMHTVDLMTQLGELTGLDLSPTLVYEAVSINGIAECLLKDLAEEMKSLQPLPAPASLSRMTPAALPGAARQPAALIGTACRFPGGANTVGSYWQSLLDGVDSVVAPPDNRPTNGKPSGYLSAAQLETFDCAAFAIPPTEAATIDPQQRLLLHVSAWTLPECF
jgi:acyl carrier protein